MFYFRLAATNLRAHKRIFVPFLLAMTLLAIMNVIMLSVHADAGAIFGNNGVGVQAAATEMFKYGAIVMVILGVILAWYANGFLLKQRTKQLALYNVIGFGKRELRLMVEAELALCAAISISLGVLLGIAFSRLSYLVLGKMLGVPGHVAFGLDAVPLLQAAGIIALIYLLLVLLDANWLRKHRPLEMLRAASAGEREPKTRWLLLIIGLVALSAGYAAAIGITDPLGALQWFFIAVVLVIIGTYALFIAGSVFIFKLLRKNKRYYYQPAHFINVANMIHRMRQNGAGLASITILATMTLVTIATTITLYCGVPQIVAATDPADLSYLRATSAETKKSAITPAQNQAQVAALAAKHHVKIVKRTVATISASVPLRFVGNRVRLASDQDYSGLFGPKPGLMSSDLMTLAHYNQMTGRHLQLVKNEILLGGTRPLKQTTLQFGRAEPLRVRGTAKMAYQPNAAAMGNALLVFKDEAAMTHAVRAFGSKVAHFAAATLAAPQTTVYLQLKGTDQHQIALTHAIDRTKLGAMNVRGAADNRRTVLHWMSAFLFMGILLGIMFILATALILYYKQVSEGLADAKRYRILQQVGLSEREVKQTINSQLLTLFYIPLIVAGVHTAIAAPFIQRVLTLFQIFNWGQFAGIVAATLAVFAVLYVIMYKATAQVYFRIVK
ncbi:FtsX-like permease family protein [Lacticaseibacillus jixianensis]|uniref:FtsX-like permease family protein n=1 Tax=Lacticaseibacillus jixianensis TaxID=2486012 RepID=A0ABW4BBR8_9LACO|nr:FtsX-like permease family protein [Lacticaseibacillus jixianensis]